MERHWKSLQRLLALVQLPNTHQLISGSDASLLHLPLFPTSTQTPDGSEIESSIMDRKETVQERLRDKEKWAQTKDQLLGEMYERIVGAQLRHMEDQKRGTDADEAQKYREIMEAERERKKAKKRPKIREKHRQMAENSALHGSVLRLMMENSDSDEEDEDEDEDAQESAEAKVDDRIRKRARESVDADDRKTKRKRSKKEKKKKKKKHKKEKKEKKRREAEDVQT